MKDDYGREINYLRISVTDRCNLRCRYCMPTEGVQLKKHGEILSLEEILLIACAAAKLGINRFRITGGEPLVRKNVVELVAKLADIPGVEDLAMTTNGILLKLFADDLHAAGLRRVNVSLDTLNGEKYRYITRGGQLDAVLEGLEAAVASGLNPVKVNMVIMRGFNDSEILDFARLARDRGLHVRFIELMPIGEALGFSNDGFISVNSVYELIREHFDLVPTRVTGNGPARAYSLGDAGGSVGFIGALSEGFCQRCNRLRLTADGKLRSCLDHPGEIDLLETLRRGGTGDELLELLKQAVVNKPLQHEMCLHEVREQRRRMSQIGG
ncbi:MAG: GTP 3',8-cyclase MoaA [Bacillota bacterium]